MVIDLKTHLFTAGLAHIALCVISLVIPQVLKWKAELSGLKPLLRQMFWNYAVYIFMINFFFGLISILATAELMNGSRLALLTTGLIALYWTGRLLVQFFYFDRTMVPTQPLYQLGEMALVGLFAYLSVIFSLAFYHNFT